MPDELITSVSNPVVKRARRLRNRKFRDAEGAFLVEGIAHVRQAIDGGAEIESLLIAPELLTSEGALAAVEGEAGRGRRVIRLGRDAFESIVDRDHPSGLLAIVRMADGKVEDLVAEPNSVFVALHDVGNPGNLGSIIRSVDAVGGAGVIVVGESTDHYHPAAVKASMGTLFSVRVRRAGSLDDLMAWALMERVAVVATSARASQDLWTAEYPSPRRSVRERGDRTPRRRHRTGRSLRPDPDGRDGFVAQPRRGGRGRSLRVAAQAAHEPLIARARKPSTSAASLS